MFERCVIKKKRTKSTEKSILIRNASELLDSGSISASDFLTSIANLKENKNRITTTKRVQMESNDDDSDDDASSPTHSQQSTNSQAPAKRIRIDSHNFCRMCEKNESNVILYPCSHAVLCVECWSRRCLQDEKHCIECFEPVKDVRCF